MEVNDVVNRLTLIKRLKYPKGLFRCSCGVEKEIRISAVKSEGTKSCGCLLSENAIKNGKLSKTHGETKSKLYSLWATLKSHKKLSKEFHDYITFKKWAEPHFKKELIPFTEEEKKKESEFITSLESKNRNREKTCLEKYGTKSPLESEKIKEKIKETNLKKYGYESASKSDIVKQNTIKNNLEKYGVEHPQYTQEYKDKISKINTKDYFNEKSRKEWAQDLDVVRSTFNARLKKYGFDIAISMESSQTEIENMISKILKDNNIKFETQKRLNQYIPDFIIEDKKLIIEADGTYWHSDAINKNKNYHKEKMIEYNKSGYFALFFREDEIIQSPKIIESIILNKLNITKDRYYARKCEIFELKDKKDFFNKNHLMGVGRGKCYALSYKKNIVCALQYTIKQGIMDISRFCPVLCTRVLGGYTKLIKYIENMEHPDKIQTFIDRRYGSGEYLKDFGYTKETDYLSFKWTKNGKTEHRLKFSGNSGYDNKYFKIWDCGQSKFVKKCV